MSPADIIRAVDRIAAKASRSSATFASELAQVFTAAERQLRPLIVAAADGPPTAIIRSVQAARTREAIRQALTDAGYDHLVMAAVEAPFDAVAAAVLAARATAQNVDRLTMAFEGRLAALKAFYETDLLDEGERVARALFQATARGIFGAQDPFTILNDLGAILDRTGPQIRTLYDTSIAIFGRQVEALQAGNDPDTPFLYHGPDDAKTRTFCQDRVGRVFTRTDIDAMDNGQLDNVFLTGGGFNCRHQWIEVSKFSSLQPGDQLPDDLRRAA